MTVNELSTRMTGNDSAYRPRATRSGLNLFETIVGAGYVPARSPVAAPEGARESVRRESLPAAACVAPVPSVRREAVPAAPSLFAVATFASVTANAAIVGFG